MLKASLVVTCLCAILCHVEANDRRLEDRYMHPSLPFTAQRAPGFDMKQEQASHWISVGQKILRNQLNKPRIENQAKNIILFIGDGMSIPTVAASRVYAYNWEDGEHSFDKFPYIGLSKTYCVDRQVPDSACTATAYLTGVKANYQTIGVSPQVLLNDCNAMNDTDLHTHSIADWSQAKGKRTGLVTTTRVTHASPAGVYAHTANRNWESDADVWDAGKDPDICHDIAHQLVHFDTGRNLNVILGGGRGEFLPKETVDEEGDNGFRVDRKNLIEEWLRDKRNKNAKYVWNRRDLMADNGDSDYLLGLFDASHCPYNLDRDKNTDPSLEEMVEAAIKVLDKGSNGFFLFVEGGRIDTAHHEAKARKSFDEVAEFSKAIQKAVDMTDEEDTLIVVTSDHSHSMTYSGYPLRGNDVLGLSGLTDQERLPYFTINYANGPGYRSIVNGNRSDPSKEGYHDKDFTYPGMFPLDAETHGGDDVGIFARGPYAHLLTGVIEENAIPHIMAYAACVGDGMTACDESSSGGRNQNSGGRNQNSGGRNQNSGGRNQNSGGRNQNSGGRNQNSGGRNQNSGGRNQNSWGFDNSDESSWGGNQNSRGGNSNRGGSGFQHTREFHRNDQNSDTDRSVRLRRANHFIDQIDSEPLFWYPS